MAFQDRDLRIADFFEKTTQEAEKLTRQRCSRVECGLSRVAMIPPPIRTFGDMVWFDDVEHLIVCDEDCPLMIDPLQITDVFTRAAQNVMDVNGIVGIVRSPDIKGRPIEN